MTAKHNQSKAYWHDKDYREFEEFQASLSPERRAADEELLNEIFKLADDSPLMAEALAWAKKRGIKFFIDRSIQKRPDGGYLGGYYNLGTGAFGIAACGMDNLGNIVNTVTHELRHVWQDDKGISMNDFTDDYAEFYISQALTEADATAFGTLAARQYRGAQLGKRYAGSRPRKYDEGLELSLDFMDWFRPCEGKTASYGNAGSRYFAQKKELVKSEEGSPGVVRGISEAEFKPGARFVRPTKISLVLQDVLPLGETFFGTANYLKRLPPDFLVKKVLRPSLANTFWDALNSEKNAATNAEQKKLLAKMRKFDIREKLARPKRRPSLPC